MIKQKQDREGKIVIDLTSPDGNAFVLLGTANKLAWQLDIDSKPILDEMMSGDYEKLIQTFDKHFGDYVDLER
jgi:hypothetical protein